jgi:hypothetical protein
MSFAQQQSADNAIKMENSLLQQAVSNNSAVCATSAPAGNSLILSLFFCFNDSTLSLYKPVMPGCCGE